MVGIEDSECSLYRAGSIPVEEQLEEDTPSVGRPLSHMSEDAKPPKAGPGFLRLNSTIYRLEMLLVTVAIILILFYWRLFLVRDFNVYLTIFWILLPDPGSLISIGLATRGGRSWPGWGSSLYNFLHTLLVAVTVLAVWSFITGGVEWPLLGLIGPVTMDRAAGYYLRASSSGRNLATGQRSTGS